jgi:DNA modification methylase
MQIDTIHNEDCLVGLSKLPDESVQCCVSSPPYYGLRDYGTATWDGGDVACDHKPVVQPRTKRERNGLTGGLEYLASQEPSYRASCGNCGAIRIDNQIGLEKSPEEYVNRLVQVFREVRRALKSDGVLFLNLGDSYGQGKQLLGIPWRVAFALQSDAWILRQDLIWHKPNPMPESVRDRCTKAHEYLFLLSKQPRYFFDADAIKEPLAYSTLNDKRLGIATGTGRPRYSADGMAACPSGMAGGNKDGRNKRSVWTVTPKPYKEAHFATMPEKLVEPCILAGSREGDTVLDPFMGAGTVAKVAQQLNRRYLGFELNAEYCALAQNRLGACLPQLKLLEQTA